MIDAYDNLLNPELFAQQPSAMASAAPWSYKKPSTVANSQSKNLLFTLEKNELSALRDACKKHHVFIINVFYAALAKAYFELDEKDDSPFEFFIAFDHRQNTIPKTDPVAIVFFAHQFPVIIDYKREDDFITLCKKARVSFKQGLQDYALFSVNDKTFFEAVNQGFLDSIEQSVFFTPGTISFLGNIDKVFAGCENDF